MKQIEQLIWDWNGTLLNDVWLCVRSINKVLQAHNKPLVTESSYKHLFDFPVKDYYAKIGFDFAKNSFEVVGTEFITEYDRHHFECRLHEGILQLLQKISEKGIKQAILSARKQAQLNEESTHFGLTKYIDHFYGLDNHYAAGKIELGKQLLKKLNTAPEKILLIGDTTHDFETAEALGINCVLMSYGHQEEKKLQKTGAQIVHSVKELEGIIFGLR